MNAATAVQQSLAKVGIHTDIQGFPHSTYGSDFAGVPNYVHQHDLGIMMYGWAADWPDGYGFLQQIVDHLVISLATAKKHVSNILGKLGATNRTQAIVRAREHGIL